ncbi:hypothetical protein GOB57_07935 [Sinorhizobium meliloti]|nr:hypothetical protein [Sinorhizobium meliloti]
MQLMSRASAEIEIEHVDDGRRPEHFVLRRGPYSYTVLPGPGCLTAGDVDAVCECAAPDGRNNGTTACIVRIYDPIAAGLAGQMMGGGWITRLQVVASSSDALRVGDYYDPCSFGNSLAIDIPNDSKPCFAGVFEDVTEEFLSAARAEQLSAREAMGTVWQRVCVDAEGGRPWDGRYGDGIVFAGTLAPHLDTFSPRERLGLLIEAGFRDIVEFETTCWRPHDQTQEEARLLLAGDAVTLPEPSFEAVAYFRLHSDELVISEVYREMTDEAVAAFRGFESPAVQSSPSLDRACKNNLRPD